MKDRQTMTEPYLFTPLLYPDRHSTPDFLARIGSLLKGAPDSYAGTGRAAAISREFICVGQDGPSILPIFDLSIHRDYSVDEIAGQCLYDELTPQEADHFEPAFRLLHGLDIPWFAKDSFLSGILRRNRGRRMTLAYLDGAIALFPSQVETVLAELDMTSGAPMSDLNRGSICTLLVAPPASQHARLRYSEHLANTSASLAKILHGHMTTSFEDSRFKAIPLSRSAFAETAADW